MNINSYFSKYLTVFYYVNFLQLCNIYVKYDKCCKRKTNIATRARSLRATTRLAEHASLPRPCFLHDTLLRATYITIIDPM